MLVFTRKLLKDCLAGVGSRRLSGPTWNKLEADQTHLECIVVRNYHEISPGLTNSVDGSVSKVHAS